MQDRFRFRLWDKFCETWLTDFAINQDGEINKFFNSEEALKRRFVLMQSTGLKDKNGKLIYEGDIVKQNNTIYSVNWCDGSFCFLNTNNINFTVDSVTPEKQIIIGNIYENPELLEV